MRVFFASVILVYFFAGCHCVKPRARRAVNDHVKFIISQAEQLDIDRVRNASDSGKLTFDSLLNQFLSHRCFEKRMRRQMPEFAHLRLSAKLYDQMWQRSDSISGQLDNRGQHIKTLRERIDSLNSEIAELQGKLDSLSKDSGALQYTADLVKTASDLTRAQSKLLSLETALIEPILDQAIKRSEQRLLQSDVFAARQVFLKDLLALKLKLRIKTTR